MTEKAIGAELLLSGYPENSSEVFVWIQPV
jgi:hypothetical protein